MIRQDDLGTIADKKRSVNADSVLAQAIHFLQKCNRIQNHPVTDYAATVFAQDTAGNQLQNELFSIDDDRVAGIVSTGVAGDHRKILGENVDNLAFAFIAPLGADNDRGFSCTQCELL